MLERLADVLFVRRRRVLVLAVFGIVVAAVIGAPVAGLLSNGGFDDPASESSRAAAYLRDRMGTGSPDVVVLVTATSGKVDDAAVSAAGARYTARLAADPRIRDVTSYWSAGKVPPLRSADGRSALVVAQVRGTADELVDRTEAVRPLLRDADGPIRVQLSGPGNVFSEVNSTIEHDLVRAEMIAIPVTAVLLVLVFGSAIAALLPLVIGILSIVGTLLVLRLINGVTDVSVFALNLTTSMGLGLGIDYSLFLVSRYREELAAGAESQAALRTTLRTAGRTVLFSAVTVGAAVIALLVFPLYFLRSFAYAGAAVVAFAALAALVVLPALLAVAGPRINAFDLRKPVRRWLRRGPVPPPGATSGTWHRIATTVMRRPWPVATAVIALLLLLGSPFLHAQFGQSDDRVLPTSAESRSVGDVLRTQFTVGESEPLDVVAPDLRNTPSDVAALGRHAQTLSALPGVSRVETAAGVYAGGRPVAPGLPALSRYATPTGDWARIVPTVEGYSTAGEKLAKAVRATPAPFATLVSGQSAEFVDVQHSIGGRLPLAIGLMGLITLVVLFLFTGSVVLPLKAVLLNLLSLSATFGALVWIFQDGHGAGLLHFTPTGLLDITMPVLMFGLVFGLSMDYEVFLLSRIREEYLRTGDNRSAVAAGLERTGRLITAAAGLLAVVFISFATSQVTFIKMMGIGLALAVIIDATLVRAALVPAFMRITGRFNWWAPGPLRRLHARIGLAEDRQPAPETPDSAGGDRNDAGERATVQV
jgi:RND superfamily putative drug exporter